MKLEFESPFGFGFWRNASAKRRRIYLVLFMFVLAFVIMAIGVFVPVNQIHAQSVSTSVNVTLNTEKANGSTFLAESIFLNNFGICLIMFFPILGPIVGFTILFDSGVALSSIAYVQGYPGWLGLFTLLYTPVFWMEFFAYSVALAESFWLYRRLFMQHRWRELKYTVLSIGLCAGVLALSAFVEAWMLTAF